MTFGTLQRIENPENQSIAYIAMTVDFDVDNFVANIYEETTELAGGVWSKYQSEATEISLTPVG